MRGPQINAPERLRIVVLNWKNLRRSCNRGNFCLGGALFLFPDVRKNKSIPVPRDRSDKPRLPRVIVKHLANCADRLAERAVGDDDVAPDFLEDVAPVHRFMPALDQENE
jgi:hypothetical protein